MTDAGKTTLSTSNVAFRGNLGAKHTCYDGSRDLTAQNGLQLDAGGVWYSICSSGMLLNGIVHKVSHFPVNKAMTTQKGKVAVQDQEDPQSAPSGCI